jgi:hypothetical protein
MVQNWNWCLSEARGEFVKYLFGDDRLAGPKALSQLVELLESHPSAALATSPRYLIDANSDIIGIDEALDEPGLCPGSRAIARCLARNCNLIGEPSAVLLRKRSAARGFNPEYTQLVDQEMWFHLLETGDLACASEPLCCFRRHGQQQTEINSSLQVGDREGARLFVDYASKPWVLAGERPREIAAVLYHLRKLRRTETLRSDARLQALEKSLRARLGIGSYPAYWLRRRIARPFQNLRRWYGMSRTGRRKAPAPHCNPSPRPEPGQ